MTLLKKKVEPKPNRNYEDYFYRNDDEDIANSFSGKVEQVFWFFVLVGIISLIAWGIWNIAG